MRELVDHVRTVHFALVIASCVMMATALSRSNRSLEQAIADAKAIADLASPAEQDLVARAMEALATKTFGPVKHRAADAPDRRVAPAKPTRSKGGPPTVAPPALGRLSANPVDAPPPRVVPGAAMRQAVGLIGQPQYEPWIADGPKDGKVFASDSPGWLYLERRDEPPKQRRRPVIIPVIDTREEKRDSPTKEPVIELDGWETVGAFQNYWNGRPTLVKTRSFLSLGEKRELSCGDGKRRTFERVPAQAATGVLRYRTTWDENRQTMDVETVFDYSDGVDEFDCVYNDGFASILDAREALVGELKRVNSNAYAVVRGGEILPFSEAFSDLDRQTTNLKNTSSSDLIRELVRRSDENEGAIEIFGASFPATVIASVGTLMILGALLYLLMHLSELASEVARAKERVPSGYIGLYGQWLPRAVTAVTLVVFPALAIWLIVGQSRQPIPSWLAADCASATAAALGMVCVWRLRLVLRLVDQVPAEQSEPLNI